MIGDVINRTNAPVDHLVTAGVCVCVLPVIAWQMQLGVGHHQPGHRLWARGHPQAGRERLCVGTHRGAHEWHEVTQKWHEVTQLGIRLTVLSRVCQVHLKSCADYGGLLQLCSTWDKAGDAACTLVACYLRCRASPPCMA